VVSLRREALAAHAPQTLFEVYPRWQTLPCRRLSYSVQHLLLHVLLAAILNCQPYREMAQRGQHLQPEAMQLWIRSTSLHPHNNNKNI
jgi:hypothetical protein